MSSAAWADVAGGKEYASNASCGETVTWLVMVPPKCQLQGPSQNKSESGLSKVMSERRSRDLETISITARPPCGISRGSPLSGGGSEVAAFKVLESCKMMEGLKVPVHRWPVTAWGGAVSCELVKKQAQHGEHRGEWGSLMLESRLCQSRWQLQPPYKGTGACLMQQGLNGMRILLWDVSERQKVVLECLQQSHCVHGSISERICQS